MAKQINLTLPFNYKCREYQTAFWEAMKNGHKRAVLVWHRRAGKEKTCWNYMILRAVQKVGIYYYIFPDSKMARRILWDGIDKNGFKMLGHVPEELVNRINNTEMKMELKNGSLILVLGSHDVDSLRGPNPIGCVFSEYAEQSPLAWQIVSPILAENDGWAIFNFTPKGQNHAKELFDIATRSESWFAQLLTVKDTKVITPEQIQIERKESMMSEDMIQQEYYCSFTLGVEGSYYARYLEEAKDEYRIGKVPHDKQTKVYTAWDFGYGDDTAITFFQIVGNEIHVIDFYHNHGFGLHHYAEILQSKKYIYSQHFAPHDIESHHFSSGLSGKEVGAKLGLNFVTLPTLKSDMLENGIEALRSIFPRLWFDAERCSYLIKALGNYRRKFDDKRNCYGNMPHHDWTSHPADSMRYMAIAIKIYVDKAYGYIDDKQAEEWLNKFAPRFE